MASNVGAVATESPPTSRTSPPLPSVAVSSDDPTRLLKRQREPDSTSPRSIGSYHLGALGSPTKSARLALAARLSPPPLTGAAALEDERRPRQDEQASSPQATSDNPSHAALASLMSAGAQTMSRLSDAPQTAPTATMEPGPKPTNTLSIPPNGIARADDRGEISPQSATSMGGVPVTESPTPMDVDNKGDQAAGQQVAVQEDRPAPGSLSYPGSLQSSAGMAETPTRGMSFPMPSQNQNSPTSASKKHKCPYCNTEFTRHHNLKSHLLTHSQEKPYVCTDCQMRFRRLHDLKRHGKLHSGEKPHICPKCDRKFARGDALARHSKGDGGCAGRRSSMGSFADGDEVDGLGNEDESAMSGIAYDGTDDDIRHQSLPNVNVQQMNAGQTESFGPQSRTYPPAALRSTSSLYPPNVGPTQATTATSTSAQNSMASNHTPGTSVSSAAVGGGATSMYSQTGVTESPKPLSPSIPATEAPGATRPRSPNLSQQQQAGRRQPELQSPHGSQPRPKLPGLPQPGYSGATGRPAPGGPQPTTDSGNMFAQSDPSVWAYIGTLEEKIKSLSDKVEGLEAEVSTLKQAQQLQQTQHELGEVTASNAT